MTTPLFELLHEPEILHKNLYEPVSRHFKYIPGRMYLCILNKNGNVYAHLSTLKTSFGYNKAKKTSSTEYFGYF